MRKVLVTGAAGFIGGRVVERLLGEPGVEPIAATRSWKGCARVARSPVKMVQCDILSEPQLVKAFQGVESVVHCAMSDSASIIEGTRSVLKAAKASGVKKVVFLSTADVYSEQEGTISESSPRECVGGWYADAKRKAEEVCSELSSPDLGVSILRPGIVYGPFCYPWTQRIGLRIAQGTVGRLQEDYNGICNAVFVDDVVEVITRLSVPGAFDGAVLNINGPERITWNEYLEGYAAALGLGLADGNGSTVVRTSKLIEPVRQVARYGMKHFGTQIMNVYAKSRWANRGMKMLEAKLRGTPELNELAVYRRRIYVDDTVLRGKIADAPRTPLSEGLAICAQYMRVLGLVG